MRVNKHHKTEKDLTLELEQIKAAAKNPKHFDVLYEKYFKSKNDFKKPLGAIINELRAIYVFFISDQNKNVYRQQI